MDKFTKLQKKKEDKTSETVWKGDYLKIEKYKNWEFINEPNNVLILPYIKYEGKILLRYEYIPTYQFKYNNFEHFITSISGTIEKNEKVQDTIKRELYEESGIILSDFYNYEIQGPFFKSKGNTSQFFTCILELDHNDYKQVKAIGDGSYSEKKSKTIKVDISDINNINIVDIFTKCMLIEFKMKYEL